MLNHANVIMQKKLFIFVSLSLQEDVPFNKRLNKLVLCSLKKQKR